MRTSLPDTLQAGDTWAWDATVDDYPSSEWTLKFVLHLRGSAATIDITATAAEEGGNNYDVTVPATYTKDYPPGTYNWMAYVEKGAGAERERYTVSEVGGTVRILPDLETADASTEGRSHARKMLDAIEAALESAAPKAMIVALTVNGKSVQYKRDDVMSMRAQYRREVARERGESPMVRIQFGSA